MSEGPIRNPRNGTFELTIRCNLHCRMCLFRHDDSENASICQREMSAEQWIDMARQVAEAGTLELLITGGEPMLRADFCEIWEGIYKQGFIITLYTNATLVTDRIMETLRKYPPHVIGVTIYGASPETYEKVTGSAEAFERAIEGIRKLRTLPSKFEYRMTVIKDNFDEVNAVETILQKEIDPAGSIVISRYVCKGARGACADIDACRPAPGQLFALSIARTIEEIRKEVGERFDNGRIEIEIGNECRSSVSISESISASKPRWTLFGCEAGMDCYTIAWDRKLLPCQMMSDHCKEIEGSFISAWDKLPEGAEVRIPEKCRTCSYVGLCHICTSTCFNEAGGYKEPPEYLCEDAKACDTFIRRLNGMEKGKEVVE